MGGLYPSFGYAGRWYNPPIAQAQGYLRTAFRTLSSLPGTPNESETRGLAAPGEEQAVLSQYSAPSSIFTVTFRVLLRCKSVPHRHERMVHTGEDQDGCDRSPRRNVSLALPGDLRRHRS